MGMPCLLFSCARMRGCVRVCVNACACVRACMCVCMFVCSLYVLQFIIYIKYNSGILTSKLDRSGAESRLKINILRQRPNLFIPDQDQKIQPFSNHDQLHLWS